MIRNFGHLFAHHTTVAKPSNKLVVGKIRFLLVWYSLRGYTRE